MRFTQPTPELEREWQTWIAERPENMRDAIARFDPWTLYRMKSTGQRVFVLGFFEPDEDGKVRCRVGVSAEFNFVVHERAVFGIDVDDLVECDLPGPDELVGSLEHGLGPKGSA